MRSSQAGTPRVQKLRAEYWEKVRDLEPDNLVFLDETGVLLGLARTHARSQLGTRVDELKPFYRGAKVTVIGAISMKKVVELMTSVALNLMNPQHFKNWFTNCCYCTS